MRYLHVLSLFIVLSILSCSKEKNSNDGDDTMKDPIDTGTFSATLDGVTFPSGIEQEYKVEFRTSTDAAHLSVGIRDRNSNDIFDELVLYCTKYYIGAIEEGDEYTSAKFDPTDTTTFQQVIGIYSQYTIQSNVLIEAYSTEGQGVAYLKITKLDKVNTKISGEFYFQATDPTSNEIYDITSGTFTDLDF